jgi:hypothetical protein
VSRHGTRTWYNTGCRCDDCCRAQREYSAQRRALARERRTLKVDFTEPIPADRFVAPVSANKHGRLGTYMNHACRCALCTEAARVYMAQRRARAAA